MRFLTACLLAAMLTITARAQEAELAGWQRETLAPNVDSYTAPDNAGMIMLGTVPTGTEDPAMMPRFGGSVARSIQSIGGLVFERPNNRSQAFEGRYAVDGFLIAIADPAGGVSIKPIGLHTEDGNSFAHYEGDVYLEEEEE